MSNMLKEKTQTNFAKAYINERLSDTNDTYCNVIGGRRGKTFLSYLPTMTTFNIYYRFLTPVEKAMKSLNFNYWANAYAFARFMLGPVKWASAPCPSMVNFVRMMA